MSTSKKAFSFALSLLIVAFAITSLVFAEESQTVRASGPLSELVEVFQFAEAVRASGVSLRSQLGDVSPISGEFALKVILPQFGPSSVVLKRLRSRDWNASFSNGPLKIDDTAEIVLVRGEIVPEDGSPRRVTAGGIFRRAGKPLLQLFFRAEESPEDSLAAVLEIPLGAKDNDVDSELALIPLKEIASGLCATVTSSPSLAHLSDFPTATLRREIDLATDADFEWFQTYGSASNTQIASLVNSAAAIYQRDLDLDFTIRNQHAWTSNTDPFTASDADGLLSQFQSALVGSSYLGSADVYHLFTGRTLSFGVIGVAFVGTVCNSPQNAVSLTAHVNSAVDALTFAHEVGHNFSASHVVTSPPSIMDPSTPPGQVAQFAAQSIAEISDHVQTYGSLCLASSGTPTPTPTPAPTPTPNPTPTPDPGGGGGTGGGGGGGSSGGGGGIGGGNVSPQLTFTASRNSRTGLIGLNLDLIGNDTDLSQCSTQVHYALNSSFSSVKKQSVAVGATHSVAVQINTPPKIKAAKKDPNTLYVRMAVACGASTYKSPTKSFRIAKGTARSLLPLKTWLTRVAKSTPTVIAN